MPRGNMFAVNCFDFLKMKIKCSVFFFIERRLMHKTQPLFLCNTVEMDIVSLFYIVHTSGILKVIVCQLDFSCLV